MFSPFRPCRIRAVSVAKLFPSHVWMTSLPRFRSLSSTNKKNLLSKDEIAQKNIEQLQKHSSFDPPKKLKKLLEVWEREKQIFQSKPNVSNRCDENLPMQKVDQGVLMYIR